MMKYRQLTNSHKNYFLTLGILFSLLSCSNKQKNADLEQAFKIHNQAIEIRGVISNKIEQLEAKTDSSFVATYGNDLKMIVKSLDTWDDQLVEVPGFEHEHDHSEHDHSNHEHDHEHDHELTPKQHLEVQQQLLQDIQAIAEKIESIKL